MSKREQWKDIEGFEGFYQVSNRGRVRSVTREVNGRRYRSRIMKPVLRQGYWCVGLRKVGVGSAPAIHRLMAAAFLPNPDNNPEVIHINGVRTDNRLSNLKWGDHADAQTIAWAQGKHEGSRPVRGEDVHTAQLTEEEARRILLSKEKTDVLAQRYKVSLSAIKHLRRGRSWRHLPRCLPNLGKN